MLISKSKKILCLVFAVLLCLNISMFMVSATDETVLEDEPTFNLTELEVEKSYVDPIPLLIILVNYDANKNGVDDFDPADSSKLYSDKSSPYYGEQWTQTKHDQWAARGFGNNDSVASYYKELTEGNFTFTPCPETCAPSNKNGKVNDGVVEVTVPYKHPEAATGSNGNEDATSRTAALKAACEYLDVKALDKDGNGKLSYDELAIAYICAGSESSAAGSATSKAHFGVHAHYTGGASIRYDGVTVGAQGFIRVGELTGGNVAAAGVLTHELGHFIGAPDLYDTTSSSSTWTYTGYMSLMAEGSWSSYGGKAGFGASYMDPFNMVLCNIYSTTTVTQDGEYTLYNRQAGQDYNIIKLCTPDPYEYYLVENRYATTELTHYDNINSQNKGIVIWHIDETIASRSKPNSKGSGGAVAHEPGNVVMGKYKIAPNYCGFVKGDVFEANSSIYEFPLSGTPFTRLTEEQAKDFNLKITVLSAMGKEMKIKIENVYSVGPSGTMTTSNITTNSATLNGRVTDLNNGNCTRAGFIVSKNSDPTAENGTVYPCVPGKDGKFTVELTDLEPNTKYFCRMYISGDNGETIKTNVFYTNAIKKERTDYYVVFMYKGITDVERSYEVKVKPGETLNYNFPMNKLGYVFCGWYKDPDFTERYDMAFTQTKCDDFALYGKWALPENVATLKIVGAESKYKNFPTEIGGTFSYITPVDKPGYVFEGWYMDPDFNLAADFDQIVPDAEEYTIYAKWAKEGEVTTESETIETTEAETTTVVTEVETTEAVTTPEEVTTDEYVQPVKNNTVVIIVVVAVSVVVLVTVLFFVFRKKKTTKPDDQE